MSQINYRTIEVDDYDLESARNFPIESLLPGTTPPPADASQSVKLGQDIRQLLRSGKTVDALRIAIDSAPLGGDESAKRTHLTTVVEVLQGIRQSDVPRVLARLADGDGGMARADCLMKYLYRGMSSQSTSQAPKTAVSPQGTGFGQIPSRNLGEGGGGQAMSVLLSWHEKLVEVVGVGGIVRVMCDRRTV